jgi:hypothetical protein
LAENGCRNGSIITSHTLPESLPKGRVLLSNHAKGGIKQKLYKLCGLCVSSEAGGELSSRYRDYERNLIFAVQGQCIPFFDAGSDQPAIDED